jgi:hypothetical protein
MGVGLRFEGLPNNHDKFIEYLMDYSCNPMAGERIYSRIKTVGYDMLTVMSALPFDEIAVGLKELFGVKMTVIPPMEGWVGHKYNDSYPDSFVPPIGVDLPKKWGFKFNNA